MDKDRVCPCKRLGESRREFCSSLGALGLGAAAIAPVALVAAGAGLNPLIDKGLNQGGGSAQTFNMGTVASLPEDGTPVKKAIIADLYDGWIKHPNFPVGAIWLRRQGDKVQAFNVLCPHNGCFIMFDQADNRFKCPCHNAFFDLTGKQNGSSISPRDMDELKVEIKEGSVFVQFQNFKFGCEDKVAV